VICTRKWRHVTKTSTRNQSGFVTVILNTRRGDDDDGDDDDGDEDDNNSV
jgi:hypothetical protein